MVRLAISVEGLTEEMFVKQVLTDYLREKGVEVVKTDNLKGKISLTTVKKSLEVLAKETKCDCVTTLYDFHKCNIKINNKKKTYENLTKAIKQTVTVECKVIAYIQMQEFEGLLFSSPEKIEEVIGQKGVAKWAKNILKNYGNDPEKVNEEGPSKRLNNEIKKLSKSSKERKKYSKKRHGPEIVKKIGLERLREKCTGFDAWITQLEALGK